MSSRTAKILNLAKGKFIENQHQEILCDVDANVEMTNYNNIEDINLSGNFLLDEALTPENIVDMINSAELVFTDSEKEYSTKISKDIEKKSINSKFECITFVPEINQSVKVPTGQSYDNSLDDKQKTIRMNDAIEKENEASDPDYTPFETDADDSDYSNLDENYKKSYCTEKEKTALPFEETDTHNYQHVADPNNKRQIEEIQNKPESRKKVKGINKREIAKQKNSFHDTPRSEKVLGVRCKCVEKKVKTIQKRKCHLISEQKRSAIFVKFWSDMSWDQRKVFVAQSVMAVPIKRPKMTDGNKSRRSTTLEYSLTVGNTKLPVCKQMFLHTTGLKYWSVKSWCLQSDDGLTASNCVVRGRRKAIKNYHEENTDFLRNFLLTLNKLPSHYCRKDTDRLYLEQQFQSFAQLHREYSKKCQENNKTPQSIISLHKVANEIKISLFHPRKDLCDICFKYKNNNLTEQEYNAHVLKKNAARDEKQSDKEKAIEGKCNVITMDVQAVKLSPSLAASSLYYRTKLCNHNFTIYNLVNQKATCYWYDETNADGQAATYASFLVEYLEENFLHPGNKLPIIVYSDGCTAQNRNSTMANALLYLSEKYQVVIYQKFLEKGHTQMECDSVHATIETSLKNKEIYLPSDYHRITKEARLKNPYKVETKPYQFFKNFGHKPLLKYKSIRPQDGSMVTDIRVLKYENGEIFCKVHYHDDFLTLSTRPAKINLENANFPQLFLSRLPITKRKYLDLQEIKKVIPQDCWPFYDLLPYK